MSRVQNRAEQITLAIALSVERGATYERPQPQKGRRTPDWLLCLADGRQIALEVTSKNTDWTYENHTVEGHTDRQGTWGKSLSHGDTDSLYKTLMRKMKDKAEHGQLDGLDREKWLCVQLDEDAGSELELLFRPVPTVVLNATPDRLATFSHAYNEIRVPRFDCLLDHAASFGYDEVWCLTQSAHGPGTTLVLRVLVNARQWHCFSVWKRYLFCKEGISQLLLDEQHP